MFSAMPGRWLALGFLMLGVALFLGNLVLLAGALYVLLVLLLGVVFVPPRDVEITRNLPRHTCWAGDELDVERTVTAGGGIGALYIHDQLPNEVDVVEGNNLRLCWKGPGEKTYDFSYRISCPKRGVYPVPETSWEGDAPLGLHDRSSGTGGDAEEITVVPRTRSIRRVTHVRGRAYTLMPNEDLAVSGTATTDFTDLRPYQPGDPMRTVNWKASARNSNPANPLLVNQYEPEGRKAVWVFMDGADYMDVGTTLSVMVDSALEAAGSIAQYHLTRGYTLGAYIYNSQSDILTPEMGQKQLHKLTDMLTQFKPGRSGQDLLQAVEWCKGFLFRLQPEVYAITRLDVYYSRGDLESSYLDGFLAGIRRLVSLRPRSRRRNQVRVIDLQSQGFQNVSTPAEEKALGLMRWEARPMHSIIRRTGAVVLPWDPKQQDFATVLMRHINVGR